MKKNLLVVVIFSAFLWSACGDESNNSDPEPQNQKSAKDYLMDGDWLVVAATLDPPYVVELFGTKITMYDLYDDLEPCEKDDLWRFKADGRLEYDEGPTKCDPNDPQTSDGGTWTLSADGKILTIMDDDDPVEADTIMINLTTLNDTDLKGTSTMDLSVGGPEDIEEFTIKWEMMDQK
jgi:hypothetical protein